jgi:hypothetical protein
MPDADWICMVREDDWDCLRCLSSRSTSVDELAKIMSTCMRTNSAARVGSSSTLSAQRNPNDDVLTLNVPEFA